MKKVLSVLLTVAILLSLALMPADALTYSNPRIIGDINNDEEIEADDATFLLRSLVGIPLPFELDGAADVDEDGSVTVLDVTFLQRHLIGVSQKLNIGDFVYYWPFDKSSAIIDEGTFSEHLSISRICPDHFYATPILPLPTEYKIYGKLSGDWEVGDHIYVTFDNALYDADYDLVECDLIDIAPSDFVPDPFVEYKPVIYLYPEEEKDVEVKLDIDGSFLYTYPEYKDGWQVTAAPDGTLTDNSGKTYPYLFWEAKLNTEYDFSSGFCVKGEDTEAFLRDKLAYMGLNNKETEDFIGFWLGFMKKNPYNVISFQTSAYTDAAKLSISPQPDTEIRVFMAWYGSETAVDIPEQNLTPAHRSGFTAVEWGGRMCR